jgi:hypothetical protein
MSITVRTDEQGLEEVVLSVPGFTRSWGPTRSGSEQELEGICPDPSKDGHALQKFDPRFLHGALQRLCECDLPRISLARWRNRSRRYVRCANALNKLVASQPTCKSLAAVGDREPLSP